jgi:peptidoglycan L-alanyl-D-glutamate endopeptidase CwlK
MTAYDQACAEGVPFTVSQGLRTPEQQAALYAHGRTAAGPIVTWTMKSRHLTGHAVDLVIVIGGNCIWDPNAYAHLWAVMRVASIACKVPLVWGGTFQGAGGKPEPDWDHFELDDNFYPEGDA